MIDSETAIFAYFNCSVFENCGKPSMEEWKEEAE